MFGALRSIPRPGKVMYGRTSLENTTIERLPEPDNLNLLVSGDGGGRIHIHALGTFPLGIVKSHGYDCF